MTCEAIRDLLPAYALGLLAASELAEVETHLATCRDHDAALVDLRATSMALDLLREDAAVPASLEPRVIGITAHTRPASRSTPTPRAGTWWLAAAAVVALLAVFVAGWATNAALDDDPAPTLIATATPAATPEVRYAYALHGANGELITFTGVEGSDKVTVRMAGFTRLQGDQRYRLWAIRDGRWERIGQCNTNAQGGWLGDFAFALRAGEEIAVTIEETTADPQPPAPPILRSTS